MAELILLFRFVFVDNRDMIYVSIIAALILRQMFRKVKQSHCPSHIYFVSGVDFLKKQGDWSTTAIQKIAWKLEVDLDQKPVETDPLLKL
ncbi:hypothetical protein KAR91_31370 [Candidatus Pacearchaeota archaeon]|nr:hypothetical protein [Candidatus Pacearchaeota archaeon]